jgi:phosphoribosylamine--glycine ligase
MKSDIVPMLMAAAKSDLDDTAVEWHSGSSICLVLASGGYPGPYEKDKAINGIDDAGAADNIMVFHAGTKLEGDDVITAGGRVLGVTGIGPSLGEATRSAYDAADLISWEGMRMRRDIGHRAL